MPHWRAAPAPAGCRHPCHLLSRQTSLPREGDEETGTALGWGARAPRPLARFSFAAPGPSSDAACSRRARALVNRLTSPAAARATDSSARSARARATDPLPHSRCPRGRTSGVGEGEKDQGARVRLPSWPSQAPAGAHARAGASRPSARDPHRAPGAGGGDADVAPLFPPARTDIRLAAASVQALWPALTMFPEAKRR